MRIAYLGLRSIGDCSGGIERHVEELSVRMANLGHEVTVFCRGKYNPRRSKKYKGVKLVNVPAVYTKHLEAISHTALSMLAMSTKYDVVHFHAAGPSLLSWVPRLLWRKVVVTVHAMDHMRAKWGNLASLVLKAGSWTAAHCPHRTIVVSKTLRDFYREVHGKDTTYIPNGVNKPVLRPLARLHRFGLKKDGYILFMGRLVEEKGAHYLIEAFKSMDTNLKLALVGGSCHTDAYGKYLLKLAGDDPRIVFTGPLYGEDKDEAFTNAKAFVLPSDLEGMPIVLLEAMSYGCPVLSSDIPECAEVFDLGGRQVASLQGTGAWRSKLCATFKAGDVQSMKTELEALLADEQSKDMGQMARRYVLGKYNWDAITKDTLALYSSALGGEKVYSLVPSEQRGLG